MVDHAASLDARCARDVDRSPPARTNADATRLTPAESTAVDEKEERAEIERKDQRVTGAAHQARDTQAEARCRNGTEQQRRQQTDANAGQHREGSGSPRRLRRPEHEAIDARVEVAERSQALPEFVDALVAARVSQPPRRDERRQLAQPVRARPNGPSARSAVSHNSAASWRAPCTPLNDTNVVLRASSRTALPVCAGSPSTSSRSSTI